MQKELVSILSPCYNTAKLIPRLLDSVLNQNYPYIEMILIDDGSEDNILDVYNSYKEKFSRKNYTLDLIKQKNQGQSGAINNAIKKIKGEFLTWPDSDDWYKTNDAISKFVYKLKELPNDYAVVRCFPTYVNETTLLESFHNNNIDDYYSTNQFFNCLFSKNFIWAPGNYMIKTSAFDKVNPSHEIFVDKHAGQNWQMLLPILYSYKCYTFNDSFFSVLCRENSHSRGQFKGLNETLTKLNSYERTLYSTILSISQIPEKEQKFYIKQIKEKYALIKFRLAFRYKAKRIVKEFYHDLVKSGVTISLKDRIKYLYSRTPFYIDTINDKH